MGIKQVYQSFVVFVYYSALSTVMTTSLSKYLIIASSGTRGFSDSVKTKRMFINMLSFHTWSVGI